MENIFSDKDLRANLLNLLHIKSYDELNKARFAESARLPHDAIKKLTSGATKNPGIKTILAIAKALGCSVDELVGYAPKEKTVSKIVSKDLEFNEALFQSTINYTFRYIQKQNLKPKIGKILHAFDNIYDYSFRRNLNQPDPNFADWVLNTSFKH